MESTRSRSAWMPPRREEDVAVPPKVKPPVMVAPFVMVEEAWERKPPAKREEAVVEVASMVPVNSRRVWIPPANVEVAVVVATEICSKSAVEEAMRE